MTIESIEVGAMARRQASRAAGWRLIKSARAQGCTVQLCASGHIKILVPGGGLVLCSGTPSDWRASRNMRALLRRAGVVV